MNEYRNKHTGAVILINGELISDIWEAVEKEPSPVSMSEDNHKKAPAKKKKA